MACVKSILIQIAACMAGVIRKVAQTTPSEFDLRKFLKPAQDAMEALCRDRFERFGTAGHAHKIEPVALSDMARRYADGQLTCRFQPDWKLCSA